MGQDSTFLKPSSPSLEPWFGGFSIVRRLRQGSGKVVALVTKDDTPGPYYVSKMTQVRALTPKDRQATLREAQLLSSLSHPSVVGYVTSFMDDQSFVIVMEFCECGDLKQQCDYASQAGQKLTEFWVRYWIHKTVAGLEYIHGLDLVHRDLKTSNVFLRANGVEVKIGDFGISKVLENAHCESCVGTPSYMSPEVCQNVPYTCSVDMWSLGVIVYELVSLELPFVSASLLGLIHAINREPYKELPGPAGIIVSTLLAKDPTNRIKAAQLVNHPWFLGLDSTAAAKEPPCPILLQTTHVLPQSAGMTMYNDRATQSISLKPRGNGITPRDRDGGADGATLKTQGQTFIPELVSFDDFVTGAEAMENSPMTELSPLEFPDCSFPGSDSAEATEIQVAAMDAARSAFEHDRERREGEMEVNLNHKNDVQEDKKTIKSLHHTPALHKDQDIVSQGECTQFAEAAPVCETTASVPTTCDTIPSINCEVSSDNRTSPVQLRAVPKQRKVTSSSLPNSRSSSPATAAAAAALFGSVENGCSPSGAAAPASCQRRSCASKAVYMCEGSAPASCLSKGGNKLLHPLERASHPSMEDFMKHVDGMERFYSHSPTRAGVLPPGRCLKDAPPPHTSTHEHGTKPTAQYSTAAAVQWCGKEQQQCNDKKEHKHGHHASDGGLDGKFPYTHGAAQHRKGNHKRVSSRNGLLAQVAPAALSVIDGNTTTMMTAMASSGSTMKPPPPSSSCKGDGGVPMKSSVGTVSGNSSNAAVGLEAKQNAVNGNGILDGNCTTSTMAGTPRPLVSTTKSFGGPNEVAIRGEAAQAQPKSGDEGTTGTGKCFQLESPKMGNFGESPSMRNNKLAIDTLFRKRSNRFPRRLQPLLKESGKVEKNEKQDKDKVEKLDKDKDKAETRNPRAGTPLAVSSSFPPQRKTNRENRPPKNLPPQQSAAASGLESIRHESRLVKLQQC